MSMLRLVPVLLALGTVAQGQTVPVGPITPAGERLLKMLDSMEIEKLWLPGNAVHWRTGTIDRDGRQRATHCSAFAAAACDRMGVYLLRPPEHSATLLANAQNAWLKSPAAEKKGWRKLKGAVDAQRAANEGKVVIASFASPNRRKPGHIAMVRPSLKSGEDVEEDGPQIMQAGSENLRDATLKHGFSKHPGAWKNGLIEFFLHQPETQPSA